MNAQKRPIGKNRSLLTLQRSVPQYIEGEMSKAY
jgi:hypothetical protein